MRTDLYTFIHKAQRYHLSCLVADLGRADLSDPAITGLGHRVLEMIEHLRDHARNEETYIHPVLHRLGAATDLEKEHHELESLLGTLEDIARGSRWAELYPAFAAFLGVYLLHLAAEERVQVEVLWTRCSEEELASVMRSFKSERPPALARADLAFMLPALSVAEVASIYRGIRSAAPAPVYQGACDLAAKTLDSERWDAVVAAI